MNRIKRIKRAFISIRNWILFSCSLIKGIFGGNSPELVLKVIMNFVTLESPYYKDTLYFSRDVQDSCALLEALITSYFETKSKVTLDQILEVLKEEFIRREENHGRKQF